MKVVFYIGWLARGGAERVISTLANMLNKLGYSCIVVTSYKAENEYLLDDGVKRIVLVDGNKRCFLKDNVKQVFYLRRILKKETPNTIVSFMGEPNFRMLIASMGLPCRKIISVRNDPSKEYSSKLYRFLARFLFPMADHIVFQTEDAQKWFPRNIQEKSSIIFNPIDDSFFSLVYNGERKNIVTVGRLTFQKNHSLLIKAFSKIANDIDDNLIIFGEGPLRNDLEKLTYDLNLQHRVFFAGLVSNVAEKIRTAKLFVLSSNYEGLPNALMEAMVMNIPCISTNCPCGGPKMLLEKSRLCNVGDVDEMAKLIKENCSLMSRVEYQITREMTCSSVLKKWIDII